MKPIKSEERRVVNINQAQYTPLDRADGTQAGESVLQLNTQPNGVGFHIYKMEAGTSSEAHEHSADEEFLVLRGELVDNDGTVYREGDLVWLKKGTQHNSYTETGCLLAVYISTMEQNLCKRRFRDGLAS